MLFDITSPKPLVLTLTAENGRIVELIITNEKMAEIKATGLIPDYE